MGNVVWNAYTRERLSAENSQRFEAQLQDIQNRSITLQASIAELKTPEGVEREIREKFNVVKGEEEIFVLVQDDTAQQEVIATTSQTWWKNILDVLSF
jgi:cell division protein FtsB